MKQIHYNIDNLLSKNATYNLIYGEKSNGKSYQVKTKIAIEGYLKEKKRFILMRRWKSDISSMWIEKYFSDIDIEKMTNNKYQCITMYRRELFLSQILEDGKIKRGEKIGYAIALSEEQHYSSGSFLDVHSIIFEEFMERGIYLHNEVERLEIFYSTIDRKQARVKVFLIGNTISRICPYLTKWNLLDIVKKQKQGTIEIINIEKEDYIFSLAIEYCKSSGGKSLSISGSSMIDKGSWSSEKQPKLSYSLKEYKKLYQIGFSYEGFEFLGDLLVTTNLRNLNNLIWFIYPATKGLKDNILIFSDKINEKINFQTDIYNPKIKNDNIKKILQTFTEDKIFYSDDLTGTDFKQAINFTIKK